MKKKTSLLEVLSDVVLGVLFVMMLPLALVIVGLPVVLVVRAVIAIAGQL